MTTVLVILAVWFVVGFVAAVVIGKAVKYGSGE
jgi:hypothetical protein